MGLSLGGRIAIDFALEHPGRVDSLVPAGPGLSGFPFSGDGNYEAIYEAALKGPIEEEAEMWLKNPYMAPAMESAVLAPRLRELARDNAHVWLDNPLLGLPVKPPAAERLSQVGRPTLVVVGARDVPDIQTIVKKLETEIPGARNVVIPGAGHMVNMERPEEFNRIVLEYPQRRQP